MYFLEKKNKNSYEINKNGTIISLIKEVKHLTYSDSFVFFGQINKKNVIIKFLLRKTDEAKIIKKIYKSLLIDSFKISIPKDLSFKFEKSVFDIIILKKLGESFILYKFDRIDKNKQYFRLFKQILFHLIMFQEKKVLHLDIHKGNITILKTKQYYHEIKSKGYVLNIKADFFIFLIDFSRSCILTNFTNIKPHLERIKTLFYLLLNNNPYFKSSIILSSKDPTKIINEKFTNIFNQITNNLKNNFSLYSRFLYFIDLLQTINLFLTLFDDKVKHYNKLVDFYGYISKLLLLEFPKKNVKPPQTIKKIVIKNFGQKIK